MRGNTHWAAAALCVVLATLATPGCRLGKGTVSSAGGPAEGKLKDQTRALWSRPETGFVRRWLICGTFPNPPEPGEAVYKHTPPCVGLETDYLADAGGEATIRPSVGTKHKRPGGKEAVWIEHVTETGRVDLQAIFAGEPTDNRVAYAYTTIRRDRAGKGFLALGSDDGVRVWLNGRVVHDHLIARGTSQDDDLVPVTFRRGDNRVLVKVENGTGGWGLILRALTLGEASALPMGELRPQIEPASGEAPDVLGVHTDVGRGDALAEGIPLRVQAVAAGGKVVGEKSDVDRGSRVRFQTGAWPDGPYEIRFTAGVPGGPPTVVHLPWYKGDWRKQAAELLDQADRQPVDTDQPKGLLARLLGEYVVDRLEGDPRRLGPDGRPADADDDWRKIHSYLMEHAELRAGTAVRAHGFARLAWRDEVDGSPQFARAFLPAEYDGRKPWPMIVNLHGYNPSNPMYIHWGGSARHQRLNAWRDAIVVYPHGRGNTGYRGIGEADVLRAIREAKAAFNVDEDRVVLIGYSMGGGGTWHVGTRHPELFAAIAPVYGGWDYHVWADEDDLAKLSPLQRYRQEASSSFAQAESLLTTPVFVNHGDDDTLVEVDHSRYAVKLLQRWGYEVRYWEHPGKGHGRLGCEAEMMRWFAAHRRRRDPDHVRIRAAALKSAKAHWVRVEQRADPNAFMHVEARVVDRTTIRLDTANVLQVRLTPPASLVETAAPIRVLWNGRDAGAQALAAGAITLRAPGYQPWKQHKRPELAGPIDEVTTTPFAIVIGTISSDPAMRRFCRLRAEIARDNWETWQHVVPRVFIDTDMTDEQIGRYSLRLFGGPDANAVTRKLAGKLPLTIAPDAIAVGGRTFAGTDAAVRMVYPHPENPDRYVEVLAANSPAGMYFSHRLGGQTDFTISDARRYTGDDDVPGEKLGIASGHFNHNWQYTEEYVELGDPAARAKTVPLKAPTQMTAAVKAERLMLGELLETRSAGSFAHMGRDVNWQGDPIALGGERYARGIAVDVWHEPCTIDYDLTGGNWRRLKAVIGIEVNEPAKLEAKQIAGTRIYFTVIGDGRELYRSPTFGTDSPPVTMDIDIAGVKELQLRVANEATWHSAAASVNWADVRLEK